MHGIGNALDLFLQRFIELPQRHDRILHSAVRHFKRREQLSEESTGGSQQFLLPPRSWGFGEHLVKRPMMQDRKSTRLNSSHLVISYAVFCLKKKQLAPD